MLNVTNGQYFNDYVSKTQKGVFVPFNEALIDGELSLPLFDTHFIKQRATLHKTTKEDYVQKMGFFFESNNLIQYRAITLWFGLDAFCQINMLGVLTYLEQIGYNGKVFYQAVDDTTCAIISERVQVSLGGFTNAYKKVACGQSVATGYDFVDKGITDYLYIKDKNNHFYKFIKDNLGKLDKTQMLIKLLDESLPYGLSDIYLAKMINEIIL